ncbi:arylsulfatase-like protein [Lojkania enalia]|uniref:Arylsulfatase n=1 Tax=Lojkania enalia TaxID=147567 RepID=A0A9P4JZ23_9PLEO|nr:arylsulfatase-like protein [Didymosphaeria enalia]
MIVLSLVLLAFATFCRGGHDSHGKRSNIVFILSDDQDLQVDFLNYMPLLSKHIIQKETFYGRHYCTTALCYPARASILTGKKAHNHNVTDTSKPYGGYPKVVSEGINDNYLPLWLQDAGYNTYYTGKLWNAHNLDNYDSPFARGFNGSEFLLDPKTYEFYSPTFTRNGGKPVNFNGAYSTDMIRDIALGFLDDAAKADNPFFLGVAPVAPNSDIYFTGEDDANGIPEVVTNPPFPAKRHKDLFNDVIVPRTPHFNPERPSGVHWVAKLPLLNATHIEFNDCYYRQRLRSLQAVDELVEALVDKLDRLGMLDNTYIVYTTDNGFHVGQHRLQPGKYCPFEEDVHIPLAVRGPRIPENKKTEIATTHTDLAPTFFSMIGADMRDDFGGAAIPITECGLEEVVHDRFEHVQVEYWGFYLSESKYRYEGRRIPNNTYKALRVISKDYNFYYAVWCTNEHELYDMKSDPYQLHNLYSGDSLANPSRRSAFSVSLSKVVARLDSLTMVLKTCKAEGCVKPWKQLHPKENVNSLKAALNPKYDHFYEVEQPRAKYDHCAEAYLLELEQPTFENMGKQFIPG